VKYRRITLIVVLLLLEACSSPSEPVESLIHTPASLATIVPTLTEGELVAAAAGTAKYSHYFPTVEECKRAVDSKEVNNCVAPDSIKQITRPEWTRLFPHTDFYVIGLLGHSEVTIYDNSYRRDLVAWQNGQYYNAETYDRLLDANGIVITDTNREEIAQAFVLMTLLDYLEEEITFSDWTQGDWPAGFGDRFSHSIKVWTRIQGLKMTYFFAFENDNLWEVDRGINIESHVGNYINVPFEMLRIPGFKSYFFGRNVN